jgi:S-adenosylmethionine hydrolase
MHASPILTLLTDFGHNGPYVAAMKGVILSALPSAHLVDLSHSITPQNVLEASFVLASTFEYFPPDTVHLAVVDPGVGTDRWLVAVRAAQQWFVLPDNGLISGVLRSHSVEHIWRITGQTIRLPRISSTFHGRDLLAPAAAHLAAGGPATELGPRTNDLIKLDLFEPSKDERGFIGEVIFRDPFGNLITNVERKRLGNDRWRIEIKGVVIPRLSRTYADGAPGSLIAIEGSAGWMEIAVVNGDASRRLEAGPGTTVHFIRETQS